MKIKKDNILIRSANTDDTILLNKWWNDGKVMEHAGFPNGLEQTLKDTRKSIETWEGKLGQLCIIEIDEKPIGELSYSIKDNNTAYAGWKICDFTYQNQGYGPKIIVLLVYFIFTDEVINSDFTIDKILWDTMIENERAQYVYERKIGAKKLAVRKNSWKDQVGRLRTTLEYSISREDFLNLYNKGFYLQIDKGFR